MLVANIGGLLFSLLQVQNYGSQTMKYVADCSSKPLLSTRYWVWCLFSPPKPPHCNSVLELL